MQETPSDIYYKAHKWRCEERGEEGNGNMCLMVRPVSNLHEHLNSKGRPVRDHPPFGGPMSSSIYHCQKHAYWTVATVHCHCARRKKYLRDDMCAWCHVVEQMATWAGVLERLLGERPLVEMILRTMWPETGTVLRLEEAFKLLMDTKDRHLKEHGR